MAISLGLHLVPAFAVAVKNLQILAPPIPIEVRRVRRVTRPPAPPPEPPAPPVEKPKPAGPPKPGAAKVARKKTPHVKPAPPAPPPPSPNLPPPPPATADLRPFAPGDAKVMFLLRADRLRASPHRARVGELLGSFPDYRTLFAGSGLDPLVDLDALLIATPNIADVTQTFLVAHHAPDGRVRAVLEQRPFPRWDPRKFRFPDPSLSVLGRPVLAMPARPDGGAPDEDPAAQEKRWLDGLANFRALADREGTPAVLITLEALDSIIHLGAGIPTPAAAAIAITGEASPSARVQLVFADAEQASRFELQWPEIRQQYRDFFLVKYHKAEALLDGLKLVRADARVELVGRVPEQPLSTVLGVAANALAGKGIMALVLPPGTAEAGKSPISDGGPPAAPAAPATPAAPVDAGPDSGSVAPTAR